jgi:3'-5' exonuclease
MTWTIFDIETRIDKSLLNQTLFRGRGLTDEAAYEEFRKHTIAERGSDFLPLSFHVPVSIAIGSVNADYTLESVESLGGGDRSEERIVREFWSRLETDGGCLVSFNGRHFDLPVLELRALHYGCVVPSYFDDPRGYRHRDAQDKHFDLHEFITNHGSYRIRGGIDLLLRTIGLPGKGEIDGSRVQGLWDAGRLEEIHDYCRRDVVQTYFLFLRIELVRGRLSAERYRQVWAESAPYRAALDA